MGFTNKHESVTTAPSESGDGALLSHIAFLEEKKATLEKSIAEHEAVSFDVNALLSAKALALSEVTELREKKDALELRVASLNALLEDLASQKIAKELELESLSRDTKASHDKSLESARIARELEERIIALGTSARELDAMVAGKQELVSSVKSELLALRAEVSRFMDEAKAKQALFDLEATAREARLAEQAEAIRASDASLASRLMDIENVKKEAEAIVAAATCEAERIVSEANARMEEVVIRDGEVSIKDALVTRKIEACKAYVTDFEERKVMSFDLAFPS